MCVDLNRYRDDLVGVELLDARPHREWLVAAANDCIASNVDDLKFFELAQPRGGGPIDSIGGAGIGGNERDH